MTAVVEPLGRVIALGAGDADRYCDHLMRLDEPSRKMRFFAEMSEFHLLFHAGAALSDGRIVVGYVEADEVRGACELLVTDRDAHRAEAAFSVETEWRCRGIGGLLMTAMIDHARRLAIRHIEMSCLRSNLPMQALAARFTADLRQVGETALAVLDNSDAASPA
ncbi:MULTISPECIES: GNAT family N-acetyltransferase [Rhodopseudomonas]|uniref:GCN5 family acetyltransferase n=1 Tax=Rhodopseudomonas palustris TaxID=1076 RepID=A0A0D7F340_RHOPL|nr:MULTISPECIES: GNAT family N-acetyltransferase [Rhodopseudomonas]KIZ47474.1 GCN5 family acetyltransferase [Rhodopseudomonas palustris]MDF3809435.1 GNAT family N-acetyltransferase [Rhodopseudomonas sp. BAL398]WOK15491.1 GNAT family N-acetyltransferase [Rhodopseudomonas sp. BAL398]